MLSVVFPSFDPVIAHIYGPLAIRWYGIAYVIGILMGWLWAKNLLKSKDFELPQNIFDDYLLWALFGAVVGGRLGYVIFYTPHLLENPLEIFKVWTGGMSFHGGLLGVCAVTWLFSHRRKISLLQFADYVACCAPLGLFFGRIANFINGELYGRITDVPWGFIFPNTDGMPRHPSQLYEAFFEGIILFTVANLTFKTSRRHGQTASIFLISYAVFRFAIEFVREPDAHIGYFWNLLSLGQILTLPILLSGAVMWWIVARKKVSI